MAKEEVTQNQTFLIALALGVAGIFLAHHLSTNEARAAQEYVDALDNNEKLPRDNISMKDVVKDLLSKIKSLEREKIVQNVVKVSIFLKVIDHVLSMKYEYWII